MTLTKTSKFMKNVKEEIS